MFQVSSDHSRAQNRLGITFSYCYFYSIICTGIRLSLKVTKNLLYRTLFR